MMDETTPINNIENGSPQFRRMGPTLMRNMEIKNKTLIFLLCIKCCMLLIYFGVIITDFVFVAKSELYCNNTDIIGLNVSQFFLMHGLFLLIYSVFLIYVDRVEGFGKFFWILIILTIIIIGCFGLTIILRANKDCVLYNPFLIYGIIISVMSIWDGLLELYLMTKKQT